MLQAKCLELIIVPPNYSLYMQCSRAFGDILREYSPLVEQYSIDEYFVDFTNMGRLYAEPVARLIKSKTVSKRSLGLRLMSVSLQISS